MGKIILVGSPKGGTGKSTTCCNLAVQFTKLGQKVVLVDADSQGTSRAWSQRREQADATNKAEGGEGIPYVHCIQANGSIRNLLKEEATRADLVVVDTGGYDGKEFRSALTIADAIFIPLRTTQIDLDLVPYIQELLNEAASLKNVDALNARVLMNILPTHAMSTDLKDSRDFVAAASSLKPAESRIHHRKIYQDAMGSGLGVVEYTKDRRAVEARNEVVLLAEEVLAVANEEEVEAQ